MKKYLLIVLTLLLVACGRSKEPLLYVINPILNTSSQAYSHSVMRIGIDDVSIPEYLAKPQLMFFLSANQSKMEDDHQWAEGLQSNVKRVLRSNLSTLIPNAVVEVAPWDPKFDPAIQLQVNINEFKVDSQGNSILQADYVIYGPSFENRKYSAYYHIKLPVVNQQTLVSSMNANFTCLSRDISRHIPVKLAEKPKESPETSLPPLTTK
ncbi:membrane integrity-associated transporter subunit PqiC [Legionella sp. 16cNR16C]|uniref:PqiC family protein n=1 Tax=Legionella sp. 16cNR16C TaxID=2905656 RepID=UPI001E638FD2|nr:PqiC family protein [Legionella sp. 16cNR16C]MCE3043770.1 PqiC family protein [Legionella sp. 16cNR16C]